MPEQSFWVRKGHLGPNRRTDFRIACADATVIDVLSPRPQSSVQVRVLDVDSSGLKLALPSPLAAGALIRIHMTDAIANAEVRHCISEGTEFHVGVLIQEIFPKR